jgi:hypothetical protein
VHQEKIAGIMTNYKRDDKCDDEIKKINNYEHVEYTLFKFKLDVS